MPLQTLRSRIDFSSISSRACELGVDSKSAAETGSLGDTTFHLSSAVALLTVRTMRNFPSKSTTMWRDDLKQNPSNHASVHLGLNLFALSRIGSLSHTCSPKPANGVPNLRPFNRLKGVRLSALTMQAQSLERRGVPSTQSDAGQHRGPPARSPQQLPSSFSRGLRRSRWPSQQSPCLQSHLEDCWCRFCGMGRGLERRHLT